MAGKEIHGSAIGQETERARLAIELARQGREVALISSGKCVWRILLETFRLRERTVF